MGLDPGRGRTKKGYFWAIARDDRPWGGIDPPAVAYTYAPGRGVVHGLKLLESYRGIVQCDGYAAYKTIADDARTGEAITLAFCWVHLRRQFFDIAKGGSAKGADGLVALVREVLRHDPFSETIFGRSGLIGLRFWRGRFGASSVLETAAAWRLQVATGE